MHDAFGHRHVGDLDAIFVLVEPHVVADANLGHDDADFRGHVLPDARDALEQIAAALRVGQPNQPDADFDLHRIDGEKILDPLFAAASFVSALWPCFAPRWSHRVLPRQA